MAIPTMWGIHAGGTGDAETLFLNENVIAIGWTKMGNLSELRDRDAVKARYRVAYPDAKPGAVPMNSGQLYRFVYEMKEGDLVLYPSRQSREIHIGRVVGPYQYRPGGPYPNQRPVRWLKNLPRTHFSQGALYELGSAMSFFQVKTYAEEFQGASEGEPAAPPEEDETVAMVAEDIEDQTRDFIIKRLAQVLKGHPLSEFVAHLLQTMGYRTRVTPPGPDRGIDIIAHKDELGFEPPLVKVQVKSGEGSVGEPVVSALSGKVGDGEYGLLVSLGDFTPPAEAFARSKNNLRLINGSELVELILQHYEHFDPRYKGILPLKKVYVPEALEEKESP